MAPDESQRKVTRRTVLRSTAVGASFGFMGSAAADSDEREFRADPKTRDGPDSEFRVKYAPEDVELADPEAVVGEYADPTVIEAELAGAVQPVLDELAENGYLAEASLSVFDLETTYDEVLEPDDDRRGVATTAIVYDDVPTAHIMATTESNGYGVGLYHQPETDNTYALVETENDRKVVHDFDGDVGVESDCSNNYYCSDEVCCTCYHKEGKATYYWKKKERCCLMADGSYSCDVSNTDCPCDIETPCC